MAEELVNQRRPSVPNLAGDVIQFLGWLTLVFSVQDLFVKGSWQKVAQLAASADGRLLMLFGGVAGVIAGWFLRHRK